MFGYLRFILASMVVLSHTGVSIYGLSPGVMAVVLFYVLAGYVVSHLYEDIFKNKKNRLRYFIKDRLLRIFPLYIYIATLTLIFINLTSLSHSSYSITAILGNLFIIPLNYYMYADFALLSASGVDWWLIPPAWSLGTELQAYLLLALTINKKTIFISLSLISFTIYIIANLSILHPDHFGYRFIIGVFFIFSVGAAINKSHLTHNRYFLIFIYTSMTTLMTIFSIKNYFSPTYTKETFIALLVGIPLIYALKHIKIKLPLNSLLGSLSYGVFLSHFLSIWILQYLGFSKNHSLLYLISIFILSILVSYSGIVLIEKKVTKLRGIA
ncbi:hypothetical protein M947_11370 [Sulfurimonas hongkongensis]|uniref:Acyltransferase 3 domain-containing protein n=1 Tax=Sulfurimonas hongkongensis TaxID=1172190 RepID=T0IZX9_9BACT|nr:acyltransferase [Sulfurimonas hongkongensis]EQB34360.1 hypothetical protein M947_11370 [Sulfurimonas hongkongensis]